MTDKNTFFQQNLTLNVGGRLLDLAVPVVMGIVNLTPDSFYDGGQSNTLSAALVQIEKMLAEGASIIDVGAYSSRPNAENISTDEELARLLPVLKAAVREFPDAIFSVDTFRAAVAEAAVNDGAHLVNDISGGQLDEEMFSTVGRLRVPYVLMHMKGNPQNMVQQADYDDVFAEVMRYFAEKVSRLRSLGVTDIILDPGFGFAKTASQSFELLTRLQEFEIVGLPILAGLSRKSMICKTIGRTPEFALNGTTAANTIALMNGAKILRVHDVQAAVEAIKIFSRI